MPPAIGIPWRAAMPWCTWLASARQAMAAAMAAAVGAGVQQFVYVGVAHPAPIMKEYIAARSDAEAALSGPGRRWPLLLLPMYWLLAQCPPRANRPSG
jgi:hypothetical protein